MFFADGGTIVESYNATKWLVQQGVDIISHSAGWAGPMVRLDGTSPYCEFVNYATQRGVMWFNAAGNHADEMWYGRFYDGDDDNYMDFYQYGDWYPFIAFKG